VLVRIVGDVSEQRWIDHEIVDGDEERVAIGLGFRGLRGADVAARASHVLDVELAAEALRQLLRYQARCHIGRTAGRKRNDYADGPRRIGLTPGGWRGEARGGGGPQLEELAAFHGCCGRHDKGSLGWVSWRRSI